MLNNGDRLGYNTPERGRLAQRLERLLHTQEATGSNPVLPRAEVAEWQTRYVQDVVSFRMCGFKSHLRHHMRL